MSNRGNGCNLFAVGQPSLGIFATEGGQFVDGHGMSATAESHPSQKAARFR